jgi:hypothetical protein
LKQKLSETEAKLFSLRSETEEFVSLGNNRFQSEAKRKRNKLKRSEQSEAERSKAKKNKAKKEERNRTKINRESLLVFVSLVPRSYVFFNAAE